MKTRFSMPLIALFLGVVLLVPALHAEGDKSKGKALSKTVGSPIRTYLNINNISTVLKNDGTADIDVAEQNSGLVFPKGSRKTAIFESGLLWGGRVNNELHVGGSEYRSGMQGGKILSPGIAEDPDLPKNRIYRVRPDYKTGDLSSEVRDEGGSQDLVRAQYDRDWKEWPAADGAPYDDKNNDGRYDPDVDVPGIKGADQTIWFVCNDLNTGLTTNMFGTNPVGIEMQVTVWAYSQQGALGNMIFKKYLIINKSTETFRDVYVSQWADPDLGNSTDDYAGCDTTLSLGYIYNANAVDATYGDLPPPSAGFDFFQGPIVPSPGSTAIFKGTKISGYKNLPMTAFFYFARGDATVTDPTLGDPAGAAQYYNFLQGRIGLTGDPFVDPNTQSPTAFALAGDPITRSGWIDGQVLPPGDRRIGLASGPFNMAPGDTQEVAVAELCAGAIPGVDRLSAIGLLKFYDRQAQLAYDNFFELPVPPPPPAITVSELDREIVINWGSNMGSAQTTEGTDSKGFKFQGYNVYQLPSASATIDNARRIATVDVVDGIGKIADQVFDASTGVVATRVRQFGNDTGIKRFLNIKNDELRGGAPLVNGIRYYFAVTSYSYNPDPNAVPNNLENPLVVLTAVPHSANPGVRYETSFGDTVAGVTHSVSAGSKSDGVVIPLTVDASKVTGHTYRVSFSGTAGQVNWSLMDVTANTTLLSNQTNQSGDNTYPIVDGLQVKVIGPPLAFKSNTDNEAAGIVEVKYGGQPLPAEGYDAAGAQFTGNTVWHSGNWSGPAESAHDRFYVSAGGGSGTLDRLTRFIDFAVPHDYEIRFTTQGGYGVYAFTDDKVCTVPFEIWDIGVGTPDDPSDDRRMIPFINENDSTKAQWGWANGTDPALGYPASDWIYFMDPLDKTPGSASYDKFAAACQASGGPGATYATSSTDSYFADFHDGFVYPIGRVIICDLDGDGATPPAGTVIRFITTKPNTVQDQFTFVAPSVDVNQVVAKSDVEKINIFPNPYYGVNNEELNKYQRFVTFNHLPEQATIRIFNLAGVLVRTIRHDQPGSQFERWDLSNEQGLPIGSGLYVAYIEMPNLGTTKVLKLAIVQERQILDRF